MGILLLPVSAKNENQSTLYPQEEGIYVSLQSIPNLLTMVMTALTSLIQVSLKVRPERFFSCSAEIFREASNIVDLLSDNLATFHGAFGIFTHFF